MVVMRPETANDVSALAREQYGMATYRQLQREGMSRGEFRTLVRRGLLIRVHAGVYAVGYVPRSREAVWMAAVLAGGEGAALSFHSAAALRRIRAREPVEPHISVPGDGGRRVPGVRVHRVELPPCDVTRFRDIPVTTVARTLADLSPVLGEDELYSTVREAMYLRVFDLAAVEEVLVRRRAKHLRLLVEELTYHDSGLERDFRLLCERRGLPAPRPRHLVNGFRVDFAWPQRKVAVEIDSVSAHSTLAAFHADRAKSNVLLALGWRLLRFTHADVKRRPGRTARTLSTVLGV